jgi:hypothetical protein
MAICIEPRAKLRSLEAATRDDEQDADKVRAEPVEIFAAIDADFQAAEGEGDEAGAQIVERRRGALFLL